MKIVERKYRGSVICRALGYPISYAIVKLLLEHDRLTLSDVVTQVKRTKQTACFHLTKLRMLNIVRYEKENNQTYYWIKYPAHVRSIVNACESFVKRTTKRIERDT